MSVIIQQATIGGTTDKRLVLENAQWAGKLAIGNSWNTLRIGFRLAIGNTGTNLISTPGIWIGLHSNPAAGMTNGPLGNACSHFVGFKSVLATWTLGSGANKCWYLGNSSAYSYGHRVGATWTSAGNNWPFRAFSSAPTTARLAHVMEIQRSGSNLIWSFVAWPTSGATASVKDVPLEVLKNSLNAGTWVGAYNVLYAHDSNYVNQSNMFTIAVDEATRGPLNAICLAWDSIAVSAYVSEVLYSVIA